MQRRGVQFTRRVGYLLGIGIIAKFFVDTSTQLFNPFLLIFAGGIGVSGLTMGRLVSLRNLSGLIAPVIGSLADRFGYRKLMRINLLLVALGLLLFSLGKNPFFAALAMIVWGAGQGGFGPNVHSYLSARLPYSRRSRYLGILEYSWAFAGIVGLFLLGYVIDAWGWKMPLYLLAAGLVGSALLTGTLPGKEEPGGAEVLSEGKTASGKKSWSLRSLRGGLKEFFYLGPSRRSAWAAILVNLFNFFAVFHVMIIHGAYLEKEFNLGPSALGTVALLMGLFDWAGSILVSIAGDKIGKRRSLLIGTAGMVLFFFLLPFTRHGLVSALSGLILPRFFFEFATVSNFPLLSEQYPAKRGKILSLGVAGGLVGTTVAATTGPLAYMTLGLWGLGLPAGVAGLFSLCLILFVVKDQPCEQDS
jgi:predicted MFS family arabinose efflux permease